LSSREVIELALNKEALLRDYVEVNGLKAIMQDFLFVAFDGNNNDGGSLCVTPGKFFGDGS
jgi:hypothetical protein